MRGVWSYPPHTSALVFDKKKACAMSPSIFSCSRIGHFVPIWLKTRLRTSWFSPASSHEVETLLTIYTYISKIKFKNTSRKPRNQRIQYHAHTMNAFVFVKFLESGLYPSLSSFYFYKNLDLLSFCENLACLNFVFESWTFKFFFFWREYNIGKEYK